MPSSASSDPKRSAAQRVLTSAVEAIGGHSRPGQEQMVRAIEMSLQSGAHLLVQAGTGTGKSLGYLAPALAWAVEHERTVVVATATLALQNQLAHKDVPVVLKALERETGRVATVQVAKGRSNYACLLRARDQVGSDQDGLFDVPPSSSGADFEASGVGAEVLELRTWIEQQAENGGDGDRDDAPSHSPRAWQQVSVSARECVGAANCRYGLECFAELARAKARSADLVITNHALLAIDALLDVGTLPERDVVIIDEAHELTDRVTGAASAELTVQQLDRLSRRAASWLTDGQLSEFEDAIADLAEAIEASELGRITTSTDAVVLACAVLRKVLRNLVSAVNPSGAKPDPERAMVAADLAECLEICARVAELSEHDVIWLAERERAGRQLHVAPLSVAGLLRETVLANSPTIMTSATLKLGGTFANAAGSVGLRQADELADLEAVAQLHDRLLSETAADEPPVQHWHGIDVGSPFDYRVQGICYLADDLPNPSREGIGTEALDRIVTLLAASSGHALGLFASQRSAETAADYVRTRLPSLSVLCQGERQLADLTKQFLAEPASCLFGTLSLWQGIDAPGETCRLVVIEKIPFPRPDDPLMQARQQRVDQRGGNGFMQVAATHAGLLLAQGAGRLIRRADDRGVVAVLDPRLAKARYGNFLLASMPDFWLTSDLATATGALHRLAGEEAMAND